MKQKRPSTSLTDEERAVLLGQEQNLPVFDLVNVEIPKEVLDLIPVLIQQRHLVLPFILQKRVLTLVMVDPTQQGVVDDIRLMTGYDVQRVIGIQWQVEAIVNRQATN